MPRSQDQLVTEAFVNMGKSEAARHQVFEQLAQSLRCQPIHRDTLKWGTKHLPKKVSSMRKRQYHRQRKERRKRAKLARRRNRRNR